MKDIFADKLQIVLAIVAGIIGSFFWGQIAAHKINTTLSWSNFYILYSSIAVLCIAVLGSAKQWQVTLSLMLAYYLSAYAFVKHWGQLGPFDLIFMAFYSLPCLGVAYMVGFIRKTIQKNRTQNA